MFIGNLDKKHKQKLSPLIFQMTSSEQEADGAFSFLLLQRDIISIMNFSIIWQFLLQAVCSRSIINLLVNKPRKSQIIL